MMSSRSMLALAAVFVSAPALAADPAQCLGCHDAGEFEGQSAATIAEALADQGIPPHRKFAELTEEQIAEILAALE